MPKASPLDELFKVILSRKGANPETSYTAKLLAKGTQKCAQKVGEEAVEVALAAMDPGADNVASESADLLYHLLVLLASCDVDLKDVYRKLEDRAGRSGLTEKASRKHS